MAGRKAHPIKLQLLNGNKGKRTRAQIKARMDAEAKMAYKSDAIKTPSWLDTVAKIEFKRLSNEMLELKLLTNVDINGLAIYCQAFSRHKKAEGKLQKNGYLYKDDITGAIRENPYLRIANKAIEQMGKIASEYGFTPASRAKIAIPKKEKREPTEFEKMFGDDL